MNAGAPAREPDPGRRRWRLALAAAVAWLAVDAVFVAGGIDWLGLWDPRVYWDTARDLAAFNPEVPPGYPLVWRALMGLCPAVPPALAGQAVSFVAYVGMVVVAHEALVALALPRALPVTWLIALYPFIGVTTSVMPRANALLRLVTFVALLGYARGWRWLLIPALAALPLLHRSALPLVLLLAAAALYERRIRAWMLVPAALPAAAYWLAGARLYHDAWWYLGWLAPQPAVLGLPIADGLIGTLVLGVRGSLPDLVKGIGLAWYWGLATALLVRFARRRQPLLVALTVPVVVFGLLLPVVEIWSMLNYTTYLAIPLAAALQDARYGRLERRAAWFWLLAGCLASQFVWAAYMIRSWRL